MSALENMEEYTRTKPLDAFEYLFSVLKYTGYYKPVPNLDSYIKRRFNEIYRAIAVFFLLLYVFQHAVFIYQSLGDLNKMMEGFIILFNFLNIAFKCISISLSFSRLDQMNVILNSKVFRPTCKEDEEVLKDNKSQLDRLTNIIIVVVSTGGTIRFSFPIIQKYYFGDEAEHPAYFPFETHSWAGFIAALVYLTIVICWAGYGDLTLDCLIAGYYTQAKVQLRIIRYHLEHLTDTDHDVEQNMYTVHYIQDNNSVYVDYKSNKCKDKLISLVERFNLVIWMSKEIENILNFPMLVQFLISAINICTIVYRLSILPLHAEYFFHMVYLSCLIFEIWIFCYYGSLLYYESLGMNDSVYLSEWTSSSPQFRRQLLIVMERWKRPILPLAAKLVPLELPTFISVLRGAYTMYTILKET